MTEHCRDLTKIHAIRNEMHRVISDVEPKLRQLAGMLTASDQVFSEVASELTALAQRGDEAEAVLANANEKLVAVTAERDAVIVDRDAALAHAAELAEQIEKLASTVPV